MKLIINKEVILESLQKCVGPTTTKQNLPILSSILIDVKDNKVKFTATDLDLTIISTQEAGNTESGKVCVPMKQLFSIVRELPSQDITLQTSKNNLLISCGKIEFKMNTLDVQEFPQIDEKKEVPLIKINPESLENMIKLTSFCVGYEDANYVLGGILFEVFKDQISLVATDGKRLSFIKDKFPSTQPEIEEKKTFILPIKAVTELYKLMKEAEEAFLLIEENNIEFDFKTTKFIARPIEGEFPNYNQYIPPESKNKLTVNRKDLLLGLRRAGLLSTIDYQGVKLDIRKDGVEISKTTPQLGEVKETINADYVGAPLEIGFNPHYLIDALKNLEDEEVVLEFFSPEKPAVLRKKDYLYLILPMKI